MGTLAKLVPSKTDTKSRRGSVKKLTNSTQALPVGTVTLYTQKAFVG